MVCQFDIVVSMKGGRAAMILTAGVSCSSAGHIELGWHLAQADTRDHHSTTRTGPIGVTVGMGRARHGTSRQGLRRAWCAPPGPTATPLVCAVCANGWWSEGDSESVASRLGLPRAGMRDGGWVEKEGREGGEEL